MYTLILRKMLLGLLSLMLVLPASVWHVCRCSHAAKAVTAKAADTPMRPCCAKRLAAEKAQVRSSALGIKAKCCCDELRWNSTITQTPPARTALPSLFSALAIVGIEIANQRPDLSAARQATAIEKVPDDPARIVFGRWQV